MDDWIDTVTDANLSCPTLVQPEYCTDLNLPS